MKALLLLSSGIDSPVAGRMMNERGVEVFALHFLLLDNKKEQEKVVKLAKKAGARRLFFADLRSCHHAFRDRGNARFTCVFCKRMMLRVAESLAEKEKCKFLITGESLGQVASQTLTNMMLINRAVKIKVFAPLLGFDKQETVRLAKEYRTYELSVQKSPGCPFLPNRPLTRASKEKLLGQEAKFDIEKLVNQAAGTVKKMY